MPTNGGDALARGAARADFGMAGIDEEKWVTAFGEDSLKKLNAMSQAERDKLVEDATAKVEEIVKKDPVNLPIKFRAVLDRIVVSRVETEEKVGGLFVPDEGKEKPAEGIVVAVGPGKYVDGWLQRPSVRVGELVVFGKFSGAEVKIGFEKYLVLREEDLFVVKEQAVEAQLDLPLEK